MTTESVRSFYDALAQDYDSIFADWEASTRRQGRVIEALIEGALRPAGEGATARSILDVSCGMGTQAIGLARRGHIVTGRDLSCELLARAREESRRRGLSIRLEAGDMRRARPEDRGRFDAVIAFDNSLPHLDRDEELVSAFRAMAQALRPDGVALASIRDYDAMLERPVSQRPRFDPPRLTGSPDARRISLQLWDWHADGERYTLHHITLQERADGWPSASRRVTYRALRRSRLSALARSGGLAGIEWLMPNTTGFYQPVRRAWARADAE